MYAFFFPNVVIKTQSQNSPALSESEASGKYSVAFLGSIVVTFALESSRAPMLERRYLKFGRKALFALSN